MVVTVGGDNFNWPVRLKKDDGRVCKLRQFTNHDAAVDFAVSIGRFLNVNVEDE